MALDRGGQLAFALGRGLFVKLARPQLGQQTGFFHRALEAAHRHFEGFIFLDTNRRHKIAVLVSRLKKAWAQKRGADFNNNRLICKRIVPVDKLPAALPRPGNFPASA